jgi:hypothetical protein
MDMQSIVAAIAGLGAAGETVKTLLEAKDAISSRSVIINLQAQIIAAQGSALSAQADQSAMLARIRELERQIGDMENWNTEKARYALVQVDGASGACLAYALKTQDGGEAPTMYHCANCFNAHGRISILQRETRMPHRAELLVCHACGSELYTMGAKRPEHTRRR